MQSNVPVGGVSRTQMHPYTPPFASRAPWGTPSGVVHRVSSKSFRSADPSFRALFGSLKCTVRRHKFNKDSFLRGGWHSGIDARGDKTFQLDGSRSACSSRRLCARRYDGTGPGRRLTVLLPWKLAPSNRTSRGTP